MNQVQQVRVLANYPSSLSSPFQIGQGLYVVASNGDILKWENETLMPDFQLVGQPSSICINRETMSFYITDFAHQSIIRRDGRGQSAVIVNQIKDYKGVPLIGPHSIVFMDSINILFFTDSGAFGQTSIQNPAGSVFAYDLQDEELKPLAYRCLASPAGLAFSQDERVVYVCQMGMNRLIRFAIQTTGFSNYSHFFQFSGSFGPSSIAVKGDNIYVGMYQFGQLQSEGQIIILSKQGQMLQKVNILGSQITGMAFSLKFPNSLWVTQSSEAGRLIEIEFKSQDKSESNQILSSKIQ